MSLRAAAWLAWSVWALCVALAISAVLLNLSTPLDPVKSSSNLGVVIAVSLLVYPTVGAFVASRRPENLVGWVLCGVGLLFVTEGFAVAYAGYTLSARSGSLPGEQIALWVSSWFDFPMVILGVTLMILLFPDGRLPARSWRAVPWVAVAGSTMWTLWLATEPGRPVYWFLAFYSPTHNPFAVGGILGAFFELLGRLGGVALLMMCVASVIGLFVRLGDSRGEARQQIKWFAYIAALLLSAPFLISPGFAIVVEAMGGPWELALALPVLASLLGIPVAIGIAILKYRLYDIDRIINRTLVYGSLTALLLLVYFGGVTATQAIFQRYTGQEELPQLVIVASTLVIAALFNPLRRRIQSLVDRRFYRRKYDAAKTLAAFNARLRDETELETLSSEVVGVVRETMQPAHVSLWLRSSTETGGSEGSSA
jgi:hypothetical protein